MVPVVESGPIRPASPVEHFAAVFTDSELITVYWHSLVMALLTAFLGTLAAYGAASSPPGAPCPRGTSGSSRALPGDQRHPRHGAGRGYLFLFSGTSLQNTLLLMILCNIVHYFSTPT